MKARVQKLPPIRCLLVLLFQQRQKYIMMMEIVCNPTDVISQSCGIKYYIINILPTLFWILILSISMYFFSHKFRRSNIPYSCDPGFAHCWSQLQCMADCCQRMRALCLCPSLCLQTRRRACRQGWTSLNLQVTGFLQTLPVTLPIPWALEKKKTVHIKTWQQESRKLILCSSIFTST